MARVRQTNATTFDISSTRVITRITRALLLATFVGITQLTLENFTIGLNPFTGFVQRHSTSLKSLSLENLELFDTDDPTSQIFVSMPKLLQAIHGEASLDHLHLQGTFTSITGTRLQCGLPEQGSLLHAVEEYVCHRCEAFPLEIVRFIAEDSPGSRICRPTLWSTR